MTSGSVVIGSCTKWLLLFSSILSSSSKPVFDGFCRLLASCSGHQCSARLHVVLAEIANNRVLVFSMAILLCYVGELRGLFVSARARSPVFCESILCADVLLCCSLSSACVKLQCLLHLSLSIFWPTMPSQDGRFGGRRCCYVRESNWSQFRKQCIVREYTRRCHRILYS